MKTQSAALAAAILAIAAPALAQPGVAAAPAAPPVINGPPISGFCVLSQNELMGTAKVGVYVQQRFSQIQAQVNADLNTAATALQADESNVRAQISATSEQAQAAAIQEVNQRAATFQQQQQQYSAQLQTTHDQALAQVLQQASPLVQQAYQAHNCSVLMDGDSVIYINEAMDITPAVAQALDLKMTTLPFDLAPPVGQGGQAAAPAAAAAPAPAAAKPATAPARQPSGPARAPARQ